MKKPLYETLEDLYNDVGQHFEDVSEDIAKEDEDIEVPIITELWPEGCMEVLSGDKRYHIIFQELDSDGNVIVQK